MKFQGGYCIVRHMPGTSPFFSRTYAMMTELKKIAPKMKCLDLQPTGLEAEKTMQVVGDWITRYGSELNGIVSADDSGADRHQPGDQERRPRGHRARGRGQQQSRHGFRPRRKIGCDHLSKSGSRRAVPMKLAADFFAGKPLDRPVYYLKKQLITKDNVEQFLPAQW